MSSIILNHKPIVLIDTSYYIFFRYFATLKWCGFQKKEFDIETIHLNEEFLSYFHKHFQNDIKKITKKWKTISSNIYLSCDCPKTSIWRHSIYSSYKSNRTSNSNFTLDCFHTLKDSITNYTKFFSESLEADDIIAILHKKIRTINSKYPIIIITNDNDYLQLSDDNTSIFNMQFKDIVERSQFDSPDKNLFFKIVLGDKSDNIPKITSIKKSEIEKITNKSKEERDNWIEKSDFKELYYKNLQLISFDYIPNDLKERFLEKVTISKND